MRTSSTSWRHRLLTAAALVPAAVGAAASGAAAAPAANPKPFAVSLSAIIGSDGTTDLALDVTSTSASYAVPTSLKHVQLKSLDAEGDVVYTANVKDLAAPGGHAAIQRNDLVAGQPVQVQVQVQTKQTKNTQVLDTTAQVLRRPDLTVAAVEAAQQARTGEAVDVSATIRELNGDLGATGVVELSHEGEVLDTIDAVDVAAGDTTGVVLATTFDEAGTYDLDVTVSGVDHEWDTTNNVGSVTVEVVSPNVPMQYWASYQSYSGEEHSSYEDYYCGWYSYYCQTHQTHVVNDLRESFSASWTATEPVTPEGTLDIEVADEDGVVETIHLTDVAAAGSTYRYDPVTGTNVQVWTSGSYTNVYVSHYAGEWTYSESYCSYWSSYCSTYGPYPQTQGQLWDARSSISVDLDLAATDGSSHGGSFTIQLAPWSSSWDYTYNDYWYYYGYRHYWGNQQGFQGWGNGLTAIS